MTTFRRRLIREKVLQVLYAHELSQDPLFFIEGQQLGELQNSPAELNFAKELIRAVADHQSELDKIITDRVSGWEFKRIAIIDRIILRMGVCELLYFPDIPPKVTINEAIEIVKLFSTDRSGEFINGVLDAILGDLKGANKLNKSGRGLIDQGLHGDTAAPAKASKKRPQKRPKV